MRKSKREKEKEREEAKRREEEELAAKTYAEFLDAFEGEGASRKGKGFVRASGSGSVGKEVDSERSEYNPRGRGKVGAGTRAFGDDDSHVRSDIVLFVRALVGLIFVSQRPPSPPAAPKPKGKRAMDDFLEVLKRYIVLLLMFS